MYAIGGTENHIHILCDISKNLSISEVIRKIKTGTSNWIKKSKNQDDFFWQHGYGVFSVSISAKTAVVAYIKNQIHHHQKMSYEDELKSFLHKHEINYDEQYLWD